MAASAKLKKHEVAFDRLATTHDKSECDFATSAEIERLFAALDNVTPSSHPLTAGLLAASRTKLARKVMEEAGELAVEVLKKQQSALVSESADLLYQLVVLWYACGITPDEIWEEMRRRADRYGIAEKVRPAASLNEPADLSGA